MEEKIIICADIIARYQGKIVFVRRLDTPKGLALPGGKQDPGETLCQTAQREFFEETGMALKIGWVLGTFADPNRDPRGRRISTVFTGRAIGTPKNESRKTEVVLWETKQLPAAAKELIFDHQKILENYLETKLKNRRKKKWQTR